MPGLLLHREVKPLGGNYLQQVGPAPSAHLWRPYHLVSLPLFSLTGRDVPSALCSGSLLGQGHHGLPSRMFNHLFSFTLFLVAQSLLFCYW